MLSEEAGAFPLIARLRVLITPVITCVFSFFIDFDYGDLNFSAEDEDEGKEFHCNQGICPARP